MLKANGVLDEELGQTYDNSDKNLVYYNNENYTLDMLISKTFLEKEFFERLERILDYKKQIIIYGPPETGKTFVTREFSKYLISKYGGGKWDLIQFHPSYSYEDFIEGIKPDLVTAEFDIKK